MKTCAALFTYGVWGFFSGGAGEYLCQSVLLCLAGLLFVYHAAVGPQGRDSAEAS